MMAPCPATVYLEDLFSTSTPTLRYIYDLGDKYFHEMAKIECRTAVLVEINLTLK